VDSDNQAYERAAVWYVGAFGALGAVLLGGASLAGVDWSEAGHPVWALTLLGGAVAAAFVVVTLAARVIAPAITSEDLRLRADQYQGRIQERNGGAPVTWKDIANEDQSLLRPIFADEAAFDDSPSTLWARAKDGSTEDRDKLRSMVQFANVWIARRRFSTLRLITPIAAVIVLAGGLAWKPLTAPRQSVVISYANPMPVQVTLMPGVDPGKLIGPGCTLHQLNGVAMAGALDSDILVAFGPQGDCSGVLVAVNSAVAIISRR
jgi:hypothetical protein